MKVQSSAPAPVRDPAAADPVYFYIPQEPDLSRLEDLSFEVDWREFVRGERAWILQTHLHLKRAGWPARLLRQPPRSGRVVFYANDANRLVWSVWGGAGLVPVGVRGDHRPINAGDFEVVQNAAQADNDSRFFVPLWSQPSLVARVAQRGTRVERVAFKGFHANLHPELQGAEWRDALSRRGIEWVADTVAYSRNDSGAGRLEWNDFSSVDVIVAIRPPTPVLHLEKPATKLYNAWRAGVPAILGPEIGFRELRQSELDFIEVATPAEALAALDRLRADPALYSAMVARGRQRAPEFADDAITARWIDLLWRVLPEISPGRPLARLPVWARAMTRRGQRRLANLRRR